MLKKLKTYTPFQQKVWMACLKITKGQVRTYSWLAKKIGRPLASRAVGSALARNPFAPIIPCHRVVPAAGGLGNYSGPGGVMTKRKLLVKEGALKR